MPLSVGWFSSRYLSLGGTDDIWLGFSGGLDSSVLLKLCAEYAKINPGVRVQAIHINHALHKDAHSWQQHCQLVCKDLHIDLYPVAVDLTAAAGANLEEAARLARRQVWQQMLPANASLLLAHHLQDQAETVLYRMFRGAGTTGLAAMSDACNFASGQLLRPLLYTTKHAIEQYAAEQKLAWITDSSNSDIKFARNCIRHTILPVINKRWPKAVENICRSAALCAESNRLIAASASAIMQSATGQAAGTLSISKLLALDSSLCFAVLRCWIKQQQQQMPSRQQLGKIKTEVMQARVDRSPLLDLGRYIIRRYRDDLFLLANQPAAVKEKLVLAGIQCGSIVLNSGRALMVQQVPGQGFILPSDAKIITIALGSAGRKAKKIFQEANIPPWWRCDYPLIFSDDVLIAIAGLWVNPKYLAQSWQVGFVVAWCSDYKNSELQ